MYIAVTGSKNNKDVYIYQSFRKKDGKSSSRIYKKLGKYNALLEQFDGDEARLMAWAKNEAAKETKLYNERTGKVTVEFSQAACIPINEARSFHAGYLFLQQLCSELRLDFTCFVTVFLIFNCQNPAMKREAVFKKMTHQQKEQLTLEWNNSIVKISFCE